MREFIFRSAREKKRVRMVVKRSSGKSRKKAGIRKDITERKKTEEALRESEEKYRFLVDNSEDFIFVISKTGRILFANKKALATIGFTQKEVIGKSVVGFLVKGSVKKTLYALAQEFLGHPQGEFNVDVKMKSGETRNLDISKGSAFVHEKGKPAGILINAHDVTEQKKITKKYEAIINTTLDGFWYLDTKGHFLDVNSAACRMLGYSRDELLKMRVSDVEAREKPEDVSQHIQKMKNLGGDRFESRHRCKDGRIINVEVSTNVIKEAEGVERIFVFSRNITERKQAEEALRESEEKYKRIVENTKDLVMLTQPNGRIAYLSSSCMNVLGYPPEDLLGKQPWIEFPDDLKKVKEVHYLALRGESGSNFEYRILTKKGRVKWISHSWSPIMRDGKLQLIVSMVRDITKEKETQNAILRNNMFNSALIENAPFGIMTIRQDGSVDYVNPAMLMISGDSKANFKSMNVFKLPTYKRFGLSTKVKACFEGQSFFLGPIDYTSHFSGKRTIRNFTGMLMRDASGEKEKVMLFVEDLTKIKEAEQEIRDSRLLLQRIINLLPIRVFWKDNNLKYLGCNEIFARDAGKKKPEELVGKGDFQMSWKEQAELYRSDDRMVINSGKPKLNFEEPQTTPKGDEIWLRTSKMPLTDLQGNTIGILGTYEDITERKKADNEINRRSEELEKFNRLAVGRELKMVELKQKIKELEAKLRSKA